MWKLSENQGSISFDKSILFEAVKKKKQVYWITLFDQLDDDLYDGDFTENDLESPKIELWFKWKKEDSKHSKNKPSASSSKHHEVEIEYHEQHNVEFLKSDMNEKLRSVIDSLSQD